MLLVMKSLFGSALYGTATPESDLDYKGIYIPSAKDIVLGLDKGHFTKNTAADDVKNTKDDIDEELYSLQYFMKMAAKGETIAIDMIHTPSNLIVDYDFMEPWDFIVANRSKLYTTDMKAYLGYVRKQASKYGIKGSRLSALRKVKDWAATLPETRPIGPEDANKRLKNVVMIDGVMHADTKLGEFIKDAPVDNEHVTLRWVDGQEYYEVLTANHQLTKSVKLFKQSVNKAWNGYGDRARKAEANEGIDWKSLHHACRAGSQLVEIYTTGDLKYPLANCEYLVKIKKGEITFKEVSEYLEHIVQTVEKESLIASKNGMPEKVDTEFWDKFVYDVYYDWITRK